MAQVSHFAFRRETSDHSLNRLAGVSQRGLLENLSDLIQASYLRKELRLGSSTRVRPNSKDHADPWLIDDFSVFTRVSTRESVSKVCLSFQQRRRPKELVQAQSAFMIDLNQVSLALRNCTSRSLILLDEFGKGTLSTGKVITYPTSNIISSLSQMALVSSVAC